LSAVHALPHFAPPPVIHPKLNTGKEFLCVFAALRRDKSVPPVANAEFGLRIYAFAKFSAIATALRMAMDLLTVSWNSPSGVESFIQPPAAFEDEVKPDLASC
jgi:hypothetical protein